MRRRIATRQIDLRSVQLGTVTEVLDGDQPPPEPPPLRPSAGIGDAPEVPYEPIAEDPIGSGGLWRAIESL